jgi:hypothetical protein
VRFGRIPFKIAKLELNLGKRGGNNLQANEEGGDEQSINRSVSADEIFPS